MGFYDTKPPYTPPWISSAVEKKLQVKQLLELCKNIENGLFLSHSPLETNWGLVEDAINKILEV